MRFLLLFALFLAVPIAELYVIVEVVGEALGLLPTLLLLVVDSIIGAALLRSQGRAAWRRFREALAAGRLPHREVLDGALVILGGALLITPGFLTDALGLALLLPPTRALARRALVRGLRGRVIVSAADAGERGRRSAPARRLYDVEGTAVEATGPPPPPAPGLRR